VLQLLAMHLIHELSAAVRTRRQEIGISQAHLAKMAGVSRATIIQLEGATIKDLSFSRTAAVLNAIGLGLSISPAHPRLAPEKPRRWSPVEIAARTGSTSYRHVLDPSSLCEALRTGVAPTQFCAHVHALLDEAPLLARVVEQMHADTGMTRGQLWANMRAMARQLSSRREIWAP
jgi:transcriptional regulator with XRE-family HTH domain